MTAVAHTRQHIETKYIAMNRLIYTAVLGAMSLTAIAQSTGEAETLPSLKLKAETRVDFNQQWDDSELIDSESGFKAKYLNLIMSGDLNNHFSYSWKQRLDKAALKSNFFEATPWVYLTYHPTENLEFSAGKQVVCIGGYEYDRSPINVYFASEFWHNISCYQLGVSGAYVTPTDRFTAQINQSPFHTSGNSNMYAYNLEWRGHHGIWQTIWSVNLVEATPGRYINYIALGNTFTISDFSLELDVMNRASRHSTFMLRDCSLMADAGYNVTHWLRPFAKYTYDVNHQNTADLCVLPGTEINTAGAGVEVWPLRKNNMDVRLHADMCYSWGHNSGPMQAMTDKRLWLNVGIKWSMILCDVKKK